MPTPFPGGRFRFGWTLWPAQRSKREEKPGLIPEACHKVCCQLALLHSAHPKHAALIPPTSLRLSLPGRLWLSAACPCAWTSWFTWECVKLTKSKHQHDTRTVSHWTQRPKARALIAGSYQLNSTECCWGSGWQGQAQTWTQLTSLSWGYLQVELMVTNHMTGIPKSETRVKNQPKKWRIKDFSDFEYPLRSNGLFHLVFY